MKTIEIKQEQLKKVKVDESIRYKDLCEILSIPYYSGGKQKILQLKELKRYIDFEQVNRKLFIRKIYDAPLQKEYHGRTRYTNHIEYILLNIIAKNQNQLLYISLPDLLNRLGMVNNDYQKYKKDFSYIDLNVTFFELRQFFKRGTDVLSLIIRDSLNRLQKKELIKYDKIYIIGRKNNDKLYFHEANSIETEYILCTKSIVMKGFSCSTELEIYWKKLTRKYRKELDYIFEREKKWYKVYEIYKISSLNKITPLPENQIRLHRLSLNDEVINRMNHHAEEKYNKNRDFYYESYVENQKILAEKLLRIND